MKRRKPYHHGDLRAALVDAALALVADEGLAALTVRQVARAAGVSHTAAFYHFETRDDLLAAMAERGFVDMAEALARAARKEDEPLAQFERIGEAYVKFALAHAHLYRLMFGREAPERARHPALQAASQALFAILVESIEACQKARLVRKDDAGELALAAWSTAHGIASLLLDRQIVQPRLAGRSAAALAQVALNTFFVGARA